MMYALSCVLITIISVDAVVVASVALLTGCLWCKPIPTLCGGLEWVYVPASTTCFAGEILRGTDFDVQVLKYGRGQPVIHKFDRGTKDWDLLPGATYQMDFRPAARGRAVKVVKHTPTLALCEVQVLINVQGE